MVLSGGSNNIFLGQDADEYNTDGNNNTIIGTGAGAATGTNNTLNGRILIGYRAGRIANAGFDNTLYLENSNSSTPLIGGDFTNDRLGVNINMTNLANLTHTLTVGGDVIATDYTATVGAATGYADYVFEDYFGKAATINSDYKFMSLNDAVSFVEKNGHLPNVKSYKEI